MSKQYMPCSSNFKKDIFIVLLFKRLLYSSLPHISSCHLFIVGRGGFFIFSSGFPISKFSFSQFSKIFNCCITTLSKSTHEDSTASEIKTIFCNYMCVYPLRPTLFPHLFTPFFHLSVFAAPILKRKLLHIFTGFAINFPDYKIFAVTA